MSQEESGGPSYLHLEPPFLVLEAKASRARPAVFAGEHLSSLLVLAEGMWMTGVPVQLSELRSLVGSDPKFFIWKTRLTVTCTKQVFRIT